MEAHLILLHGKNPARGILRNFMKTRIRDMFCVCIYFCIYIYQLVQDFFHQQYHDCFWITTAAMMEIGSLVRSCFTPTVVICSTQKKVPSTVCLHGVVRKDLVVVAAVIFFFFIMFPSCCSCCSFCCNKHARNTNNFLPMQYFFHKNDQQT